MFFEVFIRTGKTESGKDGQKGKQKGSVVRESGVEEKVKQEREI